MGDNDAYAAVDGLAAQPILELEAGSSITVANGETFTVRDGQGRILLQETGPTVISGPLTLP
jgi:hypothetical protein